MDRHPSNVHQPPNPAANSDVPMPYPYSRSRPPLPASPRQHGSVPAVPQISASVPALRRSIAPEGASDIPELMPKSPSGPEVYCIATPRVEASQPPQRPKTPRVDVSQPKEQGCSSLAEPLLAGESTSEGEGEEDDMEEEDSEAGPSSVSLEAAPLSRRRVALSTFGATGALALLLFCAGPLELVQFPVFHADISRVPSMPALRGVREDRAKNSGPDHTVREEWSGHPAVPTVHGGSHADANGHYTLKTGFSWEPPHVQEQPTHAAAASASAARAPAAKKAETAAIKAETAAKKPETTVNKAETAAATHTAETTVNKAETKVNKPKAKHTAEKQSSRGGVGMAQQHKRQKQAHRVAADLTTLKAFDAEARAQGWSCSSAGGDQRHCVHPKCDGDGCNQAGAFEPVCDGGGCDQSGSVRPKCDGGRCTQIDAVRMRSSCDGGGCVH